MRGSFSLAEKTYPRNHIYYEKINQQKTTPLSTSRATSIRTATHRYVKRPFDQDELYDLISDPQETNNLIDDSTKVDESKYEIL